MAIGELEFQVLEVPETGLPFSVITITGAVLHRALTGTEDNARCVVKLHITSPLSIEEQSSLLTIPAGRSQAFTLSFTSHDSGIYSGTIWIETV